MNEDDVRQRAQALGIAPGFHDIAGAWHDVRPEVLAHLVAALGASAMAAGPRAMAGGQAFLPEPIAAGERLWGVTLQLYGLQSGRNWGIGDFSDLKAFIAAASAAGASAVQLNPLHALFRCYPDHVSPYAPSSRLFLNPLYINVEAVPDFAECRKVQDLVASAPFQENLARLRAAPLVDYEGVAACKEAGFRLLFESFRRGHLSDSSSPRARDFRAFREATGESLMRFAIFETLCEHFRTTHPGGWPTWPEEFLDPASHEVARFAAAHESAVTFSIYLQWIARQQLCEAADAARRGSMAIGIIADIAIGIDGAGADAWADPELVVQDVELGAPPDPFCGEGQTWGIRPWRPTVMRARQCKPMRNMLDGTMRWAGGVRLDHAAGLVRQYWVPRGLDGRDGAYVSFPGEELIGEIVAASQAHRCLVIGEDLGTVPEGLSDRLRRANVLTTCVLYFERDQGGNFRGAADYPPLSCACAATHDLPPLAGFLKCHDIYLRADINGIAAAEAGAALAERWETIAALQKTLLQKGFLAPSEDLDAHSFVVAVHAFIASGSSALALAQLEDVLGLDEQANLPGTISEHPNWRRKYPVAVHGPAMRGKLAATAEIFRRFGRR